MRILGIDPGLNITGYGIIEDNGDTIVVNEAGVVRTNAKEPMEKRLLDIAGPMKDRNIRASTPSQIPKNPPREDQPFGWPDPSKWEAITSGICE